MEGCILVVDDHPFSRKLIAALLSRKTSYQVQIVETIHDALHATSIITPLLFLLDCRLPQRTGIELYDQLHKRKGLEMVPAILLSADLPDQKLEKQLLTRGIIGMSKPVKIEEFLLAIDLVITTRW